MAVLAASGAAFAQSVDTRRVNQEDAFGKSLSIDSGTADHAGGPTIGTNVAADAGAKAEAAEKPAAQQQQAATNVQQADAKPSTTAQAPQQQQTWPQVRCLSKSLV